MEGQTPSKFAFITAMPWWKKSLMLLSSAFLVGGLGMRAAAPLARSAPEETRDPALRLGSAGSIESNNPADRTSGGASLVPGEPRQFPDRPIAEQKTIGLPPEREAEGPRSGLEEWSPALVKGGLFFFVGFCAGYALRAFFKVSAVVIGLVALAVFGLHYLKVIPTIDWQVLQDYYDRAIAALQAELGELKRFAQGTLPSVGMAGLGLFTGLKRNP